MDFKRPIAAQIIVADTPAAEDLAALSAERYRTVLDLRAPVKALSAPDRLVPADEARLVAELELHYSHVPGRLDQVADGLRGLAGERIAVAQMRVLVHRAHGRRAGTMALPHLAVGRGLPASQCLDMAKAMGCDCESPSQLQRRGTDYVERSRAAHQR
jgi:protein tyrosine phosphatase (PTP) superfamily phosphohydrolase (DUF442 family)